MLPLSKQITLKKNTILIEINLHTFRCHQLFVNYSRIPFVEWQNQPKDVDTVEWDVSYTKYLINSEGCGYPPSVNCSIFAKDFG